MPDIPDAERIAAALLAYLEERHIAGEQVWAALRKDLVPALDELLDAGTIYAVEPVTAPTVSAALTPREAMRLAAEALAGARAGDYETALGLTAVADGYRQLAAVAATNLTLQPDTEGNS